jgi:quercetin dioxygenase-like cupin family protein
MWDIDPAGASFASSDEGEALWGLGGLVIVKIPSAHTGGRFAVIEQRMLRHCASPAHTHDHAEETFLVVDGHVALWIEGETINAGPGAVAHVPGGLAHAWRIESPDARMLVVTTSAHEAFYRDCCQPAPGFRQPPWAAQVDLDELVRVAKRHHVQILGPLWTAGAEPDLGGLL